MKLISVLVCLLAIALPSYAAEDEKPEDFVIASIIVADPADVLYSCVGHCALHLRCPEHGLDYVFSYESEAVSHHVLNFLAGKLKMGMYAIPTEEYLDNYRKEGRRTREYTLNLPIEVKRNLWRVLDNHVAEGINLPYDYLNRGCAHSVLMMLEEALSPSKIDYGPWPEKFDRMTRRELMEAQLEDYPWTKCALYIITNGEVDSPCPRKDKLIIPVDLVEVLSRAKVEGRIMLSSEATQLTPDTYESGRTLVRPLFIAVLMLLVTIVANIFKTGRVLPVAVDYFLLAFQFLLGSVTTYLVFFSDLVCTEWSWLLIPFNPLPLLFWKWRKYWGIPFAAVICIWVLGILLAGHSITDPCFIIVAVALAVDCAFFRRRAAHQ